MQGNPYWYPDYSQYYTYRADMDYYLHPGTVNQLKYYPKKVLGIASKLEPIAHPLAALALLSYTKHSVEAEKLRKKREARKAKIATKEAKLTLGEEREAIQKEIEHAKSVLESSRTVDKSLRDAARMKAHEEKAKYYEQKRLRLPMPTDTEEEVPISLQSSVNLSRSTPLHAIPEIETEEELRVIATNFEYPKLIKKRNASGQKIDIPEYDVDAIKRLPRGRWKAPSEYEENIAEKIADSIREHGLHNVIEHLDEDETLTGEEFSNVSHMLNLLNEDVMEHTLTKTKNKLPRAYMQFLAPKLRMTMEALYRQKK